MKTLKIYLSLIQLSLYIFLNHNFEIQSTFKTIKIIQSWKKKNKKTF